MPRERNGGFIGQDGLDAPDPPTSVAGSGVGSSLSVTFTAPTDVGASSITGYVAQTTTGIGATGTSSPISLGSLTAGTSYNVYVLAQNSHGTSAPDNAASLSPSAGRGIFAGGDGAAVFNNIEYYSLASTGNTTDFGDLTDARQIMGQAGASSTRGIFAGGQDT